MSKITQAKITELPFPDCVRLRKGMYLPNINYLVYEIVDNSVDEHLAGYATTIYVKIEEDGQIYVQDDGRGIPIMASENDPSKSMAEVAYTKLHAGGKFGIEGGYDGVKTGGLNGVGASCCNATSVFCNLYPTIDGVQYMIGFEKGITTTPLSEIGPVEEGEPTHGTLVHLKADPEVWGDGEDVFDIAAINKRMQQLAYLNAGLNIIVDINYGGHVINEQYYYEEGLKAYVEKLTTKKTAITEILRHRETVNKIDVEVALAWTDAVSEETYTFVNNIPTHLGGSHLTGFKEGVYKPISEAYLETVTNKSKVNTTQDDAREGLVAIVSVKVSDPNFEGQGKAKLNMTKVRSAVRNVVEEYLSDVLDKNPDMKKIIIAKMLDACRVREAAKRARENARKTKSLVEGGLPGKLADCTCKEPEKSEIFLVEGDSAAGTAKEGRDRHTQAILPVFGKINNVEKAKLSDVLKSVKLLDIVKAMKCGIADEFDIEKLRYHKIVVMADADVDGSHIQTLWITFFYRFYREIIEAGYLYLACPPLFKLDYGKDNVIYAYTDEDLANLIAEHGEPKNIQRYKGLGEMNAEQLWDTTMNPETRKLQRVCIEDLEADEEMIMTCMGEDVSPRREFIMQKSAENSLEAQIIDEGYEAVEEM